MQNASNPFNLKSTIRKRTYFTLHNYCSKSAVIFICTSISQPFNILSLRKHKCCYGALVRLILLSSIFKMILFKKNKGFIVEFIKEKHLSSANQLLQTRHNYVNICIYIILLHTIQQTLKWKLTFSQTFEELQLRFHLSCTYVLKKLTHRRCHAERSSAYPVYLENTSIVGVE